MNTSIVRRLVWKEYRVQRAFWGAMALLALLWQAGALLLAENAVQRIDWLFFVALGAPALYALGCGAVLFAAEHEAGTYEFQQTLPLASPRLFVGKLMFAAVSVPAMMGLLGLSAAAWSGWQLPEPDHLRAVCGLCGVAAVELFAWGVLFSLLTSGVLKAALLGAAAASLSVHLTVAPWVGVSVDRYWGAEVYTAAVPARLVVVLAVLLVDVWLGLRWLRVPPARPRSRRGAVEDVGPPTLAIPENGTGTGHPCTGASPVFRATSRETGATAAALVGRGPALSRLVWQQWRQSAGLMTVFFGTLLLLALMAASVSGPIESFNGQRYVLAMSLGTLGAALMGLGTFVADQRGRSFRYFAEHGVRPRLVWLSRQLVWAAPVLLLVALLVPFVVVCFPYSDLLFDRYTKTGVGPHAYVLSRLGVWTIEVERVAAAMILLPLAYAVSQLWSMLVRGSILAGFLAILSSGLLCGWAWLTATFGVPWSWSVLPLPLLLLLATWLRAPDWILERNRPGAWVALVALLVLPPLLLVPAVAKYRVSEISAIPETLIPAIPEALPPADFTGPMTPDEQSTMRLYERAADLYVPWNNVPGLKPEDTGQVKRPPEVTAQRRSDYVECNREAIALTLAASRGDQAHFFDPTGEERLAGRVADLGHVLVSSAEQLQAKEHLDASLDHALAALRVSLHLRQGTDSWRADSTEVQACRRLVEWSAAPGQTPERIVRSLRGMRDVAEHLPPRSEGLQARYLHGQRYAMGDPQAIAALTSEREQPRQQTLAAIVTKLLPWEVDRAQRVLDLAARESLQTLTMVRSELDAGQPPEWAGRHLITWAWQRSNTWSRLQETTPLLWCYHWPDGQDLAAYMLQMEILRRTTVILLAVEAWKRERGELPPTLDALVGPYLDRVPLDPYAGAPFRYFPRGIGFALPFHSVVLWSDPMTADKNGERPMLPAGTPFLWSAGPGLYVAATVEGKDGRHYSLRRRTGELDYVDQQCEMLLPHGWAQPIP